MISQTQQQNFLRLHSENIIETVVINQCPVMFLRATMELNPSQHKSIIQDLVTSCDQWRKQHPKEQLALE